MQILDIKGAAEWLKVPISTLRYWRNVKKGPRAINVYGRIKYDIDDLKQFVESCKEPSHA